MITPGEYTLLLTDEVQRAIAVNRGRDPLEVALDRNIPHARLVATQVKYLARAEAKLPSYAAAQCILPPLAFEQASSEACSAHKRIAGGAVLDLTCGLGADAFFLARRFRRVVALERDQTLARIAAENFRRLGATNIEVVNTSAEAYLAQPGLHFDWVYADPDRRSGDGRKLVRLEDCSPDILSLMPLISRASGRLCVKNSPLFDIGEALRLFPGARVEAVSLGDECKEVVIYADGTGPGITATALGRGSRPSRHTPAPGGVRTGSLPVARGTRRGVAESAAGTAAPARQSRHMERKRVRFRRGAARGDNWQSIRNRTYRALRPPAAETRVQRPRRGVDETGFPVRRRRAGTAAGRTCRQRRSAGLHENRERFLGCTAGIAIFARLGQRPPRRHTGLGTAPPGYGNGNGL